VAVAVNGLADLHTDWDVTLAYQRFYIGNQRSPSERGDWRLEANQTTFTSPLELSSGATYTVTIEGYNSQDELICLIIVAVKSV